MKNLSLVVLPLSALILSTGAFAEDVYDGAPFDAPYPNLVHPIHEPGYEALRDELPTRSDFETMFASLTPVRSQASRGTCSIFSSTAMLEAMLIRQGYITGADAQNLDLSEEWLEYLVTRYSATDGGYAWKNFNTFEQQGFVNESAAPYIGDKWAEPLAGQAQERCKSLSDNKLASCLLGHWNPDLLDATWAQLHNPLSVLHNPDFADIRKQSRDQRDRYLKGNMENESTTVYSQEDAKRLLSQGIPLVMGMSVYYGAWNHRIADNLGIGRNMDHWYKGIVGYPEQGSMDYAHSNDEPAGHSVLVVGYDDDLEVTTTVQMEDGTTKNFTYKGVYYIKNSWGTGAFGRDFQIDGKPYPGFGMITQRYVNEYGSFDRFPLRQKQ